MLYMGFEIDNELDDTVQIKVIGVGGGGGNAIDRMITTESQRGRVHYR